MKYLEHSIAANKREDGLYHAYNLMTVDSDSEVSISYLEEMLEGQVAVLSSGYLTSSQALSVLDGLKASKLFREDQYSYLLYPNKDLPLFEEKNSIPREAIEKSELLSSLIESDNRVLITRSASGSFHFNGNFNNAEDVKAALDQLENTGFSEQVRAERAYVLGVFEEEFNHKAFTGRSGTFMVTRGLGSIYWHMVSKLLLAVQECCQKAIAEGASEEIVGRLLEHYYEINAGIGVHKPPTLYGAFPTDPYSHTPGGKGAQQPGMTGQVKEDFFSRFGELGVRTSEGQLQFEPGLLRRSEFPDTPGNFEYVDVHSQPQSIKLAAGSIAFTYCQVPVIFTIAEEESIQAYGSDGAVTKVNGLELGTAITRSVFSRDGSLQKIEVFFKSERLR